MCWSFSVLGGLVSRAKAIWFDPDLSTYLSLCSIGGGVSHSSKVLWPSWDFACASNTFSAQTHFAFQFGRNCRPAHLYSKLRIPSSSSHRYRSPEHHTIHIHCAPGPVRLTFTGPFAFQLIRQAVFNIASSSKIIGSDTCTSSYYGDKLNLVGYLSLLQ